MENNILIPRTDKRPTPHRFRLNFMPFKSTGATARERGRGWCTLAARPPPSPYLQEVDGIRDTPSAFIIVLNCDSAKRRISHFTVESLLFVCALLSGHPVAQCANLISFPMTCGFAVRLILNNMYNKYRPFQLSLLCIGLKVN